LYNSIFNIFQFFKYKDGDLSFYDQLKDFNFYSTKLKDIVLSKFEKLKLGYIYNFKKGSYKLALKQLVELEKLNYQEPILYRKLGDCYFKLEDEKQAIENYEKYLKFDSQDVWVIVRLSELFRKKKLPDKGLETLNRFEDQENEFIVYEIGECYLQMEDFANSLSYFKRIDNKNFESLPVKLKLTKCLVFLNKYEDARKMIEKAKLLDPKNHLFDIHLADFIKMNNDYGNALILYEKSLNSPKYKEFKKQLKVFLMVSKVHCLIGKGAKSKELDESFKKLHKYLSNNKRVMENKRIHGYSILVTLLKLFIDDKDEFIQEFGKYSKKNQEHLKLSILKYSDIIDKAYDEKNFTKQFFEKLAN